jgi:hypothetical protein
VPPLLTGAVVVSIIYHLKSASVVCHGVVFSGIIIGCCATLAHWTSTFVVCQAANSSLPTLLLAVPPLFNLEGTFIAWCMFLPCSIFDPALSKLILVGVGELVTLLLVEIETWPKVFSQDSVGGLCRIFSIFLFSLDVAWSTFSPCFIFYPAVSALLFCVKGFSWPQRVVIFSFVLYLMLPILS